MCIKRKKTFEIFENNEFYYFINLKHEIIRNLSFTRNLGFGCIFTNIY